MSSEQEVRESNKDDVATFVELFSKFFYKYRYATRMVTIHPNPDRLRPLLDYYLHDNVNGWPSAAIWMDAIQFDFHDATTVSREQFDEHVEQAGRAALEELRATGHLKEREKEKGVASFPSPPDLCWEEVRIAFVSDSEIQVRARDQIRKYRFNQIGFENKKNGKPNRLWFLLKAFAAISGELSWQNLSSTRMTANQVQSNVKRLRKILRNFMDIEDDPFYPYRKVKAYKAKFTISGDADVLLDSDDNAPPTDLEKTYLEDINRHS